MKPSYEELEEQLNRSRRLCDAALANERVWETAMMKACGEDGPKSVADKFSELQARCAALAAELKQSQIDAGCYKKGMEASNERLVQVAAENAGLKAGILQASEDMEAHHDDHGLFSYDADGEQMDALLRLCDAQDSIASLENVKTPATDAFLAELRAQGLNAFIQHRSAELDAHIKNGGEQFDEKSVRIRDIIVSARLFREQIRKGVHS